MSAQNTGIIHENMEDMQQKIARLEQTIATLQEREAALKEQLDTQRTHNLPMFSVLAEYAADAIAIINLEHTIIYANATARTMTGYGDAMVGMTIEQLYDRPPAEQEAMRNQAMTCSSWSGVHSFRRKDGTTYQCATTLFPMRDARGEVWALAAYGRDITHQLAIEEALSESQAVLQGFLDHSPAPMVVKDTQGRFLLVNQFLASLLGSTPQQMIGKTMGDFFPTEYEARFGEHDAEVWLNGCSMTVEETVPTHEGMRTYLGNKFPLYDRQQRVWAIGYIATDISERKQAEAALRSAHTELECRVAERTTELASANRALRDEIAERLRIEAALRTSEERYARATQAGNVGVWDWDLGTDAMYLAPNLKAMLGYADDEIDNHLSDWNRHIHPDDVAAVNHALATYLKGETSWFEIEHRMIHKDGTIRWFIARGSVVCHEVGKPLRMSGTDTDITERKAIEEGLRRSQMLLANTFASMREAVFIIDADTVKIVDCNPAATDIFGYSRQEMLGYTTSFLHSDSAAVAGFKEHLLESVKHIGNVRFPAWLMRRKDGALIHTEHSVMPLDDAHGNRVGWVDVARDITERMDAEEALRVSEQRFRAIFEHAGIGIALANIAEKRIIDCNPAFQRFLGYTPQEIRAISVQAMTHPQDMEAELVLYHQLVGGQRDTYQIEKRYIRKDGITVWGYLTVSLLRDDADTPYLTIGLVEDITERKQAEAALRDSEERYRTLVETSPSAILLTDMDSTIRFCNQQAVELFGYPDRATLCAGSGADLVVTDPPFNPLIYLHMVERSGSTRNIEYTLRRRDGSHFPAEVNSAVIPDATGKPDALIIIVQDISERKQAEADLNNAYRDLAALNEHLAHGRNVLRAIFDGLDHGLALVDSRGCVQMINQTLASLLGQPPAGLVGQQWQTLCQRFTPFEQEQQRLNHDQLSTPLGAAQRVRCLCPDGKTCILDIRMIELRNQAQIVEQMIVQVVNVTQQVQLQARVIENERFAASGRLAASVAHEINTPLQSLELFLELARGASTRAECEHFLTYIQEEMQRVGRIVQQVLDLYRPGAAVRGAIAITPLIERLLLLLGKRFKEQGVCIEHERDATLPPVWGRADEFMQVLLNIMVNALDAMPHGGSLTVRTHLISLPAEAAWCGEGEPPEPVDVPDDACQMVAIAISDTGVGISPQMQPHIFDAFMTTKNRGTGIGLAISKQIVQQYHGYITVESQPGCGSTFTIILPLTPPDHAHPPEARPLPAASHCSCSVSGS